MVPILSWKVLSNRMEWKRMKVLKCEWRSIPVCVKSGAKSECDVFDASVERCVNVLVRSINVETGGGFRTDSEYRRIDEWMFPPFPYRGSMERSSGRKVLWLDDR